MKPPSRRRVLEALAVLAALGALWMLWTVWCYRRAVPASDETFESFAASHPAPEQLIVRKMGFMEQVTWIGARAPLSFWPKGPPVYVFARSGELVDWSYDSGVAADRLQIAAPRPGARRVTLDEARAWMKTPSPPPTPPGSP